MNPRDFRVKQFLSRGSMLLISGRKVVTGTRLHECARRGFRLWAVTQPWLTALMESVARIRIMPVTAVTERAP